MVKHKLVSFATVVALWTFVSLLIKLIRMLLKWKYMHGKNYAISVAMMRKRSYFCFVPVTGLEWSYGKDFEPGYRDLGSKNRDLGNRASPASHMNTSNFLRRKEWRGEISETEPAQFLSFNIHCSTNVAHTFGIAALNFPKTGTFPLICRKMRAVAMWDYVNIEV